MEINNYMVLLINADLINPPTSPSSFRTLTMIAREYCQYNVLLESYYEKDPYYNFLKQYGCMDFVDDIVMSGEESGIRIDTSLHYSASLIVDRIDVHNLNIIYNFIGFDMRMLNPKNRAFEVFL